MTVKLCLYFDLLRNYKIKCNTIVDTTFVSIFLSSQIFLKSSPWTNIVGPYFLMISGRIKFPIEDLPV